MQHRVEERRAYGFPVEVILPEWDEPIDLIASDLTPRGAFFYNDFLPDVGEYLVCSFNAPGLEQPFCFFGEVKRVNMQRRDVDEGRAGFAVSFLDTQPLERLQLRRALRRERTVTPGRPRSKGGPISALGSLLTG